MLLSIHVIFCDVITYVTCFLCVTLQEMRHYACASSKTLPRGLYLGYLKLASSMEHINIMVPDATPNVLPHVRVRDNAHVSR